MRSNIFDKLSFLSLFLVIALSPIFCLPFTNIPPETSKGLLLVAGLALAVIFWAAARFTDGRIVLPKSWLLVSGLGIVLVFFLSAFFSKNPEVSFFGTMFEPGSFFAVFAAFILMLMSAIVLRKGKQAKMVLLGVILSSILVLIFQIVHLFFPAKTSLGIIPAATSNIFGSWSGLGLFAGFTDLLLLLVIEFFPITKTVKIILSVLALMGIFLIAVVNFPLVWILLGISSLIILVYKASINLQGHKEEQEEKKLFPVVSFVVVLVSLLFYLNPLIPILRGGSPEYLDNIIPARLQILNKESYPTFKATMSVTAHVLGKHPVLGIGPNRFSEAWAMYKGPGVNGTDYWDVPFSSGSGLLPTIFSTVGYLGILSSIVFAFLFLFIGAKSVFWKKTEANFEIMAFFVLALYLFISVFFYSPGSVMLLLALAFSGALIGMIAQSSEAQISISFFDNRRRGFIFIFILIFIMFGSLAAAFKYIERFASVPYFGKALSADNVAGAEASINKALALDVNDLYLRVYAQIYLLKLNSLIKSGESVSDKEQADLQNTLTEVVNGAQLAVAYNEENYLNFQALGSIYQSLGSFGVKNVYGKAVEAYKTASTLNPNNPGLKLSAAVALFSEGKIDDAKSYANMALTLKPDYVDALVILSRIAENEGSNTMALDYARRAFSIAPANADLAKYIESLKNKINSGTSEGADKSNAAQKKP